MHLRAPSLRYWFAGIPFFVGLANTVFVVLVSIIAIAPITQSGLKWSLLGVGVVIALGVWWALALAAARDAERDKRLDELPARIAALGEGRDFEGVVRKLVKSEGDLAQREREGRHLIGLYNKVVDWFDRAQRNDDLGSRTVHEIDTIIRNDADIAHKLESIGRITSQYRGQRASGQIAFAGDAPHIDSNAKPS